MPVFRNRQRPDKQMVQQRKIKQNRSPFESVAAYSLVTEQHTRIVIGMCGRNSTPMAKLTYQRVTVILKKDATRGRPRTAKQKKMKRLSINVFKSFQ